MSVGDFPVRRRNVRMVRVPGVVLTTNVAQTLYTAVRGRVAFIHSIAITNHDAVARNVAIASSKSLNTFVFTFQALFNEPVPAKTTVTLTGDPVVMAGDIIASSGWHINAYTAAGVAVVVRMFGIECDGYPGV
jgi:hypothetical protein